MKPSNDPVAKSLSRVEAYARSQDYAGVDKFDALNSTWVEKAFGFSWPTRLIVTQVVNRAPLPLRSLLRVRKARNPKGIANFVKGYAALVQAGERQYLTQLESLAEWLLANDSATLGAYRGSGICWGYQFPWQSPGFFTPRHSPNCIVTTFAAEALLAAYRVTGNFRYLNGAIGAKDFILNDLPVLEAGSDFKCIGYVHSGPRWKVININSVVAGFLAKLSLATKDESLMKEARAMINWVMSVRNLDYSWNYTHPKSQSGIRARQLPYGRDPGRDPRHNAGLEG